MGVAFVLHRYLQPERTMSHIRTFLPLIFLCFTQAAFAQHTKEFYDGLWAAPGSEARKQSGKLLASWLPEIFALPAKSQYPGDKRDRDITEKVMRLSAEYLQADKTCDASQKIRLYRGLSTFQLARQDGKALTTWSSRTYLAAMGNQPIPASELKNHNPDPLADLRLKIMTQQTCLNCFKDGSWSEIIRWHSGTGSGTSPIMSTSLEWSVARRFSNPYMLVLDVCPERAIAVYNVVDNQATFPEAEVYLPLFALPEEITAVVELPEDDPFYKLPAEYASAPNAVTKGMRRLFFSQDLPFDVQYLVEIAPLIAMTDAGIPSQEEYYNNFHPEVFYNLILARDEKAEPLSTWRDRVVKAALATTVNPAVCNYSYDTFRHSDVYKSGSKPASTFRFPRQQRVRNAKFNLEEYRQVAVWQREWVDMHPGMDSSHKDFAEYNNKLQTYIGYFRAFENYHFVKADLYKGYQEKCRTIR